MAKISFGTVRLDYELQRLGSSMGRASTTTSQFGEQSGDAVELDAATGLVIITNTKSGEQHVIPRERVLWFKSSASAK